YSQSENKGAKTDPRWPTKRELRRKLWEIRKELLVYGTNNPVTVNSYKRFAENYTQQMRWLDIIVKPDSLVTSADLDTVPLWLIGTPTSNSLLAKMQPFLPVKMEKNKFSIAEVTYTDSKDIFTLSTYPNPFNRALPISIISGNSDESVVAYLLNIYRWSARAGDFRVFRDGKGVAFGFFAQEKNGPWKVDTDNFRNYLNLSQVVLETAHFVFTYHGQDIPEKRIQKFAQEQERRLSALLNRLHKSKVDLSSFPKIDYHFYESLEDKGLITGNTDLSHFNLENWQVHTIFNDDLNGGDFYSDAKLIFYKYVGKSESQALRDGVAMYFSEGWGKRGYQYWAKLLHNSSNVNALEDLLNSNMYNKESYLFMRPLAGSFVAFLIAEYGWSKFLALYKRWPSAGLPPQKLPGFTIQELEQRWSAYLERLNVDIKAPVNADNAFQPKFQKGFCYAHEGYQIYNGYLSRKSFESLQKLRSLGTDWISLSTFGYLNNRNQPGYLRYSFGAGSENDESLIQAFLYAKSLGMGVMLKPHILMRSMNWGWPGEVAMQNEEAWQLFFKYYYSWIRHYALLAEMYHMDLLCIGVELMQTTRDHQAEWREIIAKIRQIYHGPLVYAANWYREFEQIT
ncbi:MAG: hypothetical protein ACE5HX_17165, partial [bacterium]